MISALLALRSNPFLVNFLPKIPLETAHLVSLISRFLRFIPLRLHSGRARLMARGGPYYFAYRSLSRFADFFRLWGGVYWPGLARFGPISTLGSPRRSSRGPSPVGASLFPPFNSKPPRLSAERSADGRSAEGACGASLSCASGAAKRNCASQGQTCPAEQCHEQPPRVGASS